MYFFKFQTCVLKKAHWKLHRGEGVKTQVYFMCTVKCNLTELTTKSACIPLVVSSVLICACVRIPHVLRLRSAGSHYRTRLLPLPSLPLFPLFNQCDGCVSFIVCVQKVEMGEAWILEQHIRTHVNNTE